MWYHCEKAILRFLWVSQNLCLRSCMGRGAANGSCLPLGVHWLLPPFSRTASENLVITNP